MTSQNSVCQLYLIRHGETDWNQRGLLQGHTDIPLNDAGRKQALELQEKLKHIPFTKAVSSDLKRAKETAHIVLQKKGISVIETEHLRERGMGQWEGKPVAEFRVWDKTKQPGDDECHGIERADNVITRLKAALQKHAEQGETLLVSTHGFVLRAFLDNLQPLPNQSWLISNCAFVKILMCPKGRISLVESQGIQQINLLA